jgi:hypothetical protein
MKAWLTKLRPSPWLARRLAVVVAVVGVGIAAFAWGRHHASSHAADPQRPGAEGSNDAPMASARQSGDYGRRAVAFLYGDVPITREDLGEYLITRFGQERLDFLINRQIVELECRKRGIVITEGEVEAQLKADIASFGKDMTLDLFVNQVLKKFGKSLVEWKEDVIRPKLQMNALVKPTVTVTPDDIQKEFETRFGPKVECRIIVMPDNLPAAKRDEVWHKVSKSEAAFLEEAGSETTQYVPDLRPKKGLAPPIPMHYFDKPLEKEIFNLEVGQITQLRQLPDKSWVILRCERHIPKDESASMDAQRGKLIEDVTARKLAMAIPVTFQEMQNRARPRNLLRPAQPAAPTAVGSNSKLGGLGN